MLLNLFEKGGPIDKKQVDIIQYILESGDKMKKLNYLIFIVTALLLVNTVFSSQVFAQKEEKSILKIFL